MHTGFLFSQSTPQCLLMEFPMQGAFFLSVHSGFSLGLREVDGSGAHIVGCGIFVHKADVYKPAW